MKYFFTLSRWGLLCLLVFPGMIVRGQPAIKKYLTPDEINSRILDMARENTERAKVITMAKTPGGRSLQMLEIGKDLKAGKKNPAVLVVANPEGDVPLSDLAVLYLAGYILDHQETLKDLNWYIIAGLNPDAEMHFFQKPLYRDQRNGKPHNDDMDDQVDEDGFNDLNGDGIITQMRVKDPAGVWLPVDGDQRLLRKADPVKGEKGMYKLYTEGLDDDGDGLYNEDGPGGTDVGINFPHLFRAHTAAGGLWPGSSGEAYALMKFVSEHPEIAMTMVYGSTNFCLVPPKKGRKGSVDMNRIKVPKDMAKMIGADPDKTYTMKELIELVQPMVPSGMEITESDIAGFLGLGAIVNPLDEDLKYYKELSDRYKDYLKEKGMNKERLDPAPAKDGSVELWSYYHVGVPTFSMDFWTLPKPEKKKKKKSGLTAEQIGKMSKDDFLALDNDTLTVFLKEAGAPAQFGAEQIKGMVRAGQLTPEKIVTMLKQMPRKKETGQGDPKMQALVVFSDKYLEGKGFVNWQPVKHPIFGDVEIGGAVPYADNTPPPRMIDSLLSAQVPWIFTLTGKLARLGISDTRVTPKGGGVYELNIWIENKGYLPFPTAMGKKNRHVPPAVVQLKGQVDFLEGRDWTPVQSLGGKAVKKLSWLIRADKSTILDVTLESPNAWGDRKQIKIGGVL
ncbi:MAG: hypothetical protein J7K46_02195 [Bacteroidales bacterium]|nr:hypothetical protein [Bacteroidales bacterium]